MHDNSKADSSVTFTSGAGLEVTANLIRLSRLAAVFEFYDTGGLLRTSELLDQFKIFSKGRTIFSGNAVVKSLIDSDPKQICEVTLSQGWLDVVKLDAQGANEQSLRVAFDDVFNSWQKCYKISADFKVLTSDLVNLLTDYRLWLEQVEVGIRASPSADRPQLELKVVNDLKSILEPPLDALFERYEQISAQIEEDVRPSYQQYVRRLLHPFLLSSPFAFRTVLKPLGYAGDYEVVKMLLEDSCQGSTLFGKILNRWFIKQPPAEAHRNRISYLIQKLVEETSRVTATGRVAKIYNLGCGPVDEIQKFLQQHLISDKCHFTLLDFNEETLAYADRLLRETSRIHGRGCTFELQKKSVGQILKNRPKAVSEDKSGKFDFVYCAGLFDYLTDSVCKHLISIFYNVLKPGGLMVVTNVTPFNPIRNWLEDILDWHLIYRDAKHMLNLCPGDIDHDLVRASTDITGVNVFLEMRKPAS